MTKALTLMKFLAKIAVDSGVGENTYVVGGAVRNYVINEPIKDIDVVIDSITNGGKDATWFANQVVEAIPVLTKLVTNQYNVAIIQVLGDWWVDGTNLKGEWIEIASARKEKYGGASGMGYKPSQVEMATISEDVYRREFTFNTLLWRMSDLLDGPNGAEIIDLTGVGLAHLNMRVMQCPRDPNVVFSDDPTRILRAFKFIARYGFKMTQSTKEAITRSAHAMGNAPWEAIGKIFVENILEGPNPIHTLTMMKHLGVLNTIAVLAVGPFESYLSRQLKGMDVSLLLTLVDVGLVGVKSPVSFLSFRQRLVLKKVVSDLSFEEAQKILADLTKPPIDQVAIFEQFNLLGKDRSLVIRIAREVIFKSPNLVVTSRLQQDVIAACQVNFA